MAQKWIFSCFLILGTLLYLLIYHIQISHAGILKSIESGKLLLDSKEQQLQENYNNKMTNMTNNNSTVNANHTTMTDGANKNLTAIKWAHAVNNQQELNAVLESDIEMIEADIVLGKLINGSDDLLPVMGHPPANTSDISLNSFLQQILAHNNKNDENKKGVKLDFKSTEVFEGSVEILKKLWSQMDYPIWLNADIVKGPVNETTVKPVDPKRFLDGCKDFNTATLSIGWTTRWGFNYTEGSYSDNYINEMLETIKTNSITMTKHKITFPVRAGIAAYSQTQLHKLVKELNQTNDVTLTIWSSHNDSVDINKLRDLIFSFGVDRVYLDVPIEVSSKLNLDKSSTNGANSITSFAGFSIISLCLVAASFLKEYQF